MSVVKRPLVLVSNDDGIQAPGLRALVAKLAAADFCEVVVCAPSSERSAQSHAITLGRYLSAESMNVPGSTESYAVDGTPADSVMLALRSHVFKEQREFDLVVSGINRGDNAGLHVHYSGTVGAAREAACKGLPAMALSLANHGARSEESFSTAATLAVSLIQAALGLLPGQLEAPIKSLQGYIVNVNFPGTAGRMLAGYWLSHQGMACVFPAFKEIVEEPGPHLPEIDAHTPNVRMYRNYMGRCQEDDTEGSDSWALHHNYVSVTPLMLRQDVPFRQGEGAGHTAVIEACWSIVQAAGEDTGISSGGMPAKL